MTGRISRDRVRHTDHHWTGWIHDGIAATQIATVSLTAKRHRNGAVTTLDSRLHPNNATGIDIGFQRWNGRCVVGNKVTGKRVVPVKNNYAVLTEVESRQVGRRKLSVRVSGT